MKIFDQIIQNQVNLQKAGPEKLVLKYNSKSEYIPLYGIQKPVPFFLNTYTTDIQKSFSGLLIYMKLKEKKTWVSGFLASQIAQYYGITDIWKEVSLAAGVKRAQILLETPLSQDFDLKCATLYNMGDKVGLLKADCQGYTGGDNSEFWTNLGFLMDQKLNKILFCTVIKKELQQVFFMCCLLNKPLPEEAYKGIQIWVRREFIETEKYKTLSNAFKKEILDPFILEEGEVQIRESFEDLFLNLQRPQIKSIKEQKEFFETKSSEILEKLRIKNKLKFIEPKKEVKETPKVELKAEEV